MPRVLLCCVQPTDQWLNRITDDVLAAYFARYGPVVDAKIFSSRVLIKAFVEFRSESSALSALANSPMPTSELGAIRLYESQKSAIMREDSSQASPTKISSDPTSANGPYCRTLFEICSDKVSTESPPVRYHPWPIGWTTLPVLQVQEPQPQAQHSLPPVKSVQAVEKSSLSIFAPSISNPRHFEPSPALHEKVFQWPHFLASTPAPVLAPAPRFSKVVIARRWFIRQVTPAQLLALLSCYGQVKKLMMKPDSNSALVEYESPEDAALVVRILGPVPMIGHVLRVKATRHLSISSIADDHQGMQENVLVEADQGTLVNKRLLGTAPAPPGPVLFFYFCPDKLTSPLLDQLLGEVAKPVSLLEVTAHRSFGRVYRAEFTSKEEAVEVLVTFDRLWVDDRRISINFAGKRDRKGEQRQI